MPVGGAHGGGHEGISHENMWEKEYVGGDLKKDVHKGDTKLKISQTLQKDALEEAIAKDSGLTSVEEGPSARSSERVKNFVYTNNANNPRLPQNNAASANPPRGPGGTGNPFFALNPMVTFFTEFLEMIKMQEKMEKLANQFTVTDARITMGMAKDQATDILGAAKAQSKMYETQATSSFIQAGVSGAMTITTAVMAGFALKDAFGEVADQANAAKAAQQNFKDVEQGADEYEEVANAQGTKLAKEYQQQELKDAFSGKGAEEALPEEAISLKPQDEAAKGEEAEQEVEQEGITVKEKTSQRTQKIKADEAKNAEDMEKNDKLLKETDEKIDELDNKLKNDPKNEKLLKERQELVGRKEQLNIENEQLHFKAKQFDQLKTYDENMENNLGAMTNLGKENKEIEQQMKTLKDKVESGDKTIDPAEASDEINYLQDRLEANMIKKNQILNAKQDEIDEASQKLEKAETDLSKNPKVKEARNQMQAQNAKFQEMSKGAIARAGQHLTQNPIFMTLKGIEGSINQGMQGWSSLAQAQGTLTASYWEAQKAEVSAYQQIMQSAMGSAQEVYRDCYQQANDLAGTLTKMSDQEQQSMHWAA